MSCSHGNFQRFLAGLPELPNLAERAFEGDAVSLTVNTDGEALVAYRELDSYPFPVEGSLKVAYESKEIFSDGFESGDTTAWSGVAK